jgi:hypothetical protein
MSSAPRLAPLALNCTPTTPTLSEASAVTVIVPETVAPSVGEVIATVGGVVSVSTVKLLLLVAVPPGVVTLIGPVVAPEGTVARISVADATVKLALTPLKRTAEAPLKWLPVMSTIVPAGPLVGEKPVIVGGGMTVKLLLLLAVPPGVVTLIGPVVAPAGTVAWIAVAELTVKPAFTSLKRTAVAPPKFVPLIVTLVPAGPLVGEKPVMVGGLTLETVTETALDVHRIPSASRATAVRLCGPFATVLVFQETEYGGVESLPMKLPSTKNSTFATVREPTMLTLALTGIVPLTVEPEAGEVMVTIRLPVGSGGGGSNCAGANCGAIQPQLTIAQKTAVPNSFLILFIVPAVR